MRESFQPFFCENMTGSSFICMSIFFIVWAYIIGNIYPAGGLSRLVSLGPWPLAPVRPGSSQGELDTHVAWPYING